MRNVLGLSAVLLMCLALSSCSGSRPEKAFIGTWKVTKDGKTAEISFMKKGILILNTPDEKVEGTWVIDPEGNAVMTIPHGTVKVIATLLNDKQIAVRREDKTDSGVFEKSGSKRK